MASARVNQTVIAHAKCPNAEECLRAIAQLAGLVAMGLLKPAQANAIRASFREILQHHRQTQVRQDRSVIGDADILDLMAKDASILNMLSPILTDEQVEMIMKRSKGDRSGTT